MQELDKSVQFSGFVGARNNETTIRWQKVQIFFLINSVLFGGVISTNLSDVLKILTCSFGLVVTLIWWLMQWEAQNAIDYWNAMAAKLENKEISGFSFANPKEGFKIRLVSTHYLILFLIDLFGIVWTGLLVYYSIG